MRSGNVSVAYQVVGDGQSDLVWVPGIVSHLDAAWNDPDVVRGYTRLARMRRLILFDKRGTGMSDRVAPGDLPSFDERIDDIRAVMDTVGSERAAIVAWSEGAALACLFAATYPERVERLVLYGGFARIGDADGYDIGRPDELRAMVTKQLLAKWAEIDPVHEFWAPSRIGDPDFWERWAQWEALAASPAAAEALVAMGGDVDVRAVLPSVHAPTLVIHREGDVIVPLAAGQYLAEHIPGARLVTLPGQDHLWWVGDSEAILDQIEEFLTGVAPERETERVLATVLFTDICDSTQRVADLGDRRWRDLLQRHDDVFREHLARFRGQEVKTTGDGFLATFDAPARAIRCAHEAGAALSREGISIRAGLHTGECELRDDDIAGIAVHIAARVAARAAAGEVLVSRTVTDLVTGAGIRFDDRGSHALKGVPGEWRLFAVRQ